MPNPDGTRTPEEQAAARKAEADAARTVTRMPTPAEVEAAKALDKGKPQMWKKTLPTGEATFLKSDEELVAKQLKLTHDKVDFTYTPEERGGQPGMLLTGAAKHKE